MDYKKLRKKLEGNEARVCIVGLGYVGLPLALAFADSGLPVLGFDVSREKVEDLKRGVDPTGETGSELKRILKGRKIKFTTEPGEIQSCDFIIICVPTPIMEDKSPDLEYIGSAGVLAGRNMGPDSIIVLESTVYPGVTEEFLKPIIERESKMRFGEGFTLGYSPERINPGDMEHTLGKITKVVSGSDRETLFILKSLYGRVSGKVYPAEDIKTAEAAKVIENIQRDLNIALMNELSLIFGRMGINIYRVLDAAGTKWNFHRYRPGLVGGHCLDKSHNIFIENNGNLKTEAIGDYFKHAGKRYGTNNIGEVKVAHPKNAKILTFDLDKKTVALKELKQISERHGKVLELTMDMNQKIRVSERHPMIVHDDGKFYVKHACSLKPGDKIPVSLRLPQRKLRDIDIISHLSKGMMEEIRVKPINRRFREFKETLQIKKNCGKRASNFYTLNYLPLKFYLKLEEMGLMPLKRDEIYLVTGRGPSMTKIRAILKINKNFMRLIGYYLSEGCITKDKSLRTRWVFNEDEKKYLEDLRNCLRDLDLKFSEHSRKLDKGYCIKVSSKIFGFVIKDILKCGTNSYTMKIPDNFLFARDELRIEILKGLLRGDGSVYYINKKKTYRKNGKTYTHNVNSACVDFFSISPPLFQQVVMMLLHFKIIPTFDKNRPLLSILGYKNLGKMIDFFDGKERKKLESYFRNKRKFIRSKYERYRKAHRNVLTVPVKSVKRCGEDSLYSVETEGTNTFITDYGIIVHNCIPVDPYYLVHKAKELGYEPRVILAGRGINNYMPFHISELALKGLEEAGKKPGDSKILLLGLTFKKNVRDLRNSPAKSIIAGLKNKVKHLAAYDPAVTEGADSFGVAVAGDLESLRDIDCIIMVTDHDAFRELDFGLLRKISGRKPVLVDARGFFDPAKAREAGFIYLGI